MSEIFNITHDANNLNEYDSTVTDAGDLSTSTPGLADTTAKMEALIDDTTPIYGDKTFSYTTRFLRIRLYVDPNNLTLPSGKAFAVLYLSASGPSTRAYVQLRYDGSNYEIQAAYRDDSGTDRKTGAYDITNEEHYVEVLWARATGVTALDGYVSLWVDGALQETLGSLDIWNYSRPSSARIGAANWIDTGTSGTLHLDEIKANDDGSEIGPVVAAPLGFASIF